MFECTLLEGELFKKIIAALSDLVTEGNFLIDSNQISFQGMDSSHVSLVSLSLQSAGFDPYRCDRDITLGVNFSSLNKILKCMKSKDKLNINANEESDSVFFQFGSLDNKIISNFELKLMDIDSEQLGIPETEYGTTIKMSSTEFQRICRDLSAIGDSVIISATKEGIQFSVNGDIGSGNMVLKGRMRRIKKKKEENDNDNDNDDNNNNNDEKEEKEEKKEIESEPKKVKNEPNNEDGDGDEIMGNNDNNDNKENDKNEEEEEYEEYEANVDDEDEENNVTIILNESVTQTFALRYLNNFTKATNLSTTVTLSMGSEVPLRVEYRMGNLGYIQYYLAPKIDDEE